MAGDLAYVTCQNGDALTVVDLEKGVTIQQWDLPGKPAGVAIGNKAIFTVAADAKKVRKHNLQNGHVSHEIRLDGSPIGVAVDPNRSRLFVSDWYNARIWVLAASDLTLIGELETGAAPAGLAISDDGKFLSSADRDADQVSVYDAETLALLHRIGVGTRPFGLGFAPDGKLFVGNVGSDNLSVVDPETGATIATIPVGARP
ncbi:YncE family protein [Roseobacter sp.]|uniref:YncE family protein n=1 Tax=Roseobacter sp. TaxID=1907202 RepID=UPI00385DE8EF